jgi:hypothetical protein
MVAVAPRSLFGVVEVGSESDNDLFRETGGQNYGFVSVSADPQPMSRDLWQLIADLEVVGNQGDIVDGVVVALHKLSTMLAELPSTKRIRKRITVFTDAGGVLYIDDGLDAIAKHLQNSDIELAVYIIAHPSASTASARTAEMLSQETSSDKNVRLRNVASLSKLTSMVHDASELEEHLRFLMPPPVEPRPMGFLLEIGSMKLPLKQFVKVSAVKPSVAKDCVIVDGAPRPVTKQTRYSLQGKIESAVQPQDVVRAYKYGPNQIPLDQIDLQAQAQSQRCLQLMCFAHEERFSWVHFMSNAKMMIPDPADPSCCDAIALLVKGMIETRTVGIVRFIYRAGLEPKICALFPHAKRDYCAFDMFELPYFEDYRDYSFKSLSAVSLSADERDAANQLVQALNIDSFTGDKKAFGPRDLRNADLQYFYEALHARWLDPKSKLIDPPGHIKEMAYPERPGGSLNPMHQLATPSMDRFRTTFPVQQVAEETGKKRSRFWFENIEDEVQVKKPRMDGGPEFGSLGHDVSGGEKPKDNAAGDGSSSSSSSSNAPAVARNIPPYEFDVNNPLMAISNMAQYAEYRPQLYADMIDTIQKMLQSADELAEVRMYDRAFLYARVFRESCVMNKSPSPWNSFLREAFRDVQNETMEARKRFHDKIKESNLGLITETESVGGVSEEEAKQFWETGPAENNDAIFEAPTLPAADQDIMDLIE